MAMSPLFLQMNARNPVIQNYLRMRGRAQHQSQNALENPNFENPQQFRDAMNRNNILNPGGFLGYGPAGPPGGPASLGYQMQGPGLSPQQMQGPHPEWTMTQAPAPGPSPRATVQPVLQQQQAQAQALRPPMQNSLGPVR